jgi:hypothetical protein
MLDALQLRYPWVPLTRHQESSRPPNGVEAVQGPVTRTWQGVFFLSIVSWGRQAQSVLEGAYWRSV